MGFGLGLVRCAAARRVLALTLAAGCTHSTSSRAAVRSSLHVEATVQSVKPSSCSSIASSASASSRTSGDGRCALTAEASCLHRCRHSLVRVRVRARVRARARVRVRVRVRVRARVRARARARARVRVRARARARVKVRVRVRVRVWVRVRVGS